MTSDLGLATLLIASLAAVPVLTSPVCAQSSVPSSSRQQMSERKQHRVVIQVSENDPKIMNLALNNAENLAKSYEQSGEAVQIEIVAYGPGLNMVRSDTSPVKDRLAALVGRPQPITFTGCGNTMSAQSKQEGKEISLLPETHLVPTGIGRIVQLQEQGWTYIRP
jgi:intracellular sulfur oxidation DsrE/DsrF family protein